MITLRFDDCFRSQYDIGYKILKQNNLKAVMFPVGNRIINKCTNSKSSISLKELLEMQDYGIEIGYHSRTHTDLRELSLEELYKETNPNELKQAGLNIKSFCIPFSKGSNDNKLIQVLSNKMKYENICGIPSRQTIEIGQKPLIFNSMTIYHKTDIKELENILNNIIKNKHYLILCFHSILPIEKIKPDDECSVDLNLFNNIINLICKKKKEGLIDVTFQEYNEFL